jgi:hypothetical protein
MVHSLHAYFSWENDMPHLQRCLAAICFALVLLPFCLLAAPTTASSNDLFVAELAADTIFTDIGAGLPGAFAGNALWFDYDNDGDLDILVSGYDDTVYFSSIYRNDSGTFTDIQAGLLGLQSDRGVSYGDYDNDGDVDIAIQGRTNANNTDVHTKIYRNDNGAFTDIGAPLLNLDGGSTNWVDYDNDGALDLFVCGSTDNGYNFAAKLYKNVGGSFEDVLTNISGVWGSSASWADFDNDGDLDLFLFGWGGYGAITKLYRNDNGAFLDLQIPFPIVVAGTSAWIDVDNDGDLDLAYNGAANGLPYTFVCRNLGASSFSIMNTGVQDLAVSAMAWGDYDNDGDLDFAESGSLFFSGESPTTKIYRNDNGTFVDIETTIPGVWFGTLAWGDYDNDGRLDLLMTGGTTDDDVNGKTHPITRVYRNGLSTPNTLPSAPQNTIATVGLNTLDVAWDNATDAQTPTAGLTYNLRLGTSPGSYNVVNSYATPTGKRRVPALGNTGFLTERTLRHLPAGTYYWSVQAVDNGYAASAFSAEQSVTIPDSATDAALFTAQASWNLVSLPRDPASASVSAIFPTAVGNAFAFTGSGYAGTSTMQGGTGYWLKFAASQAFAVSGTPRYADTVSLQAGWNIIGGLSVAVPVSSIESIPPGMTTSSFYGFTDSYASSSSILPGRGYWVKMPSAGSLVLRSTGMARPRNAIRVNDTGELPPSPPTGMEANLPASFALDQNYPNPFNPSTTIRYALPTDQTVRLAVYNLLGEEVARLVDGTERAGFRSATFDGAGFATGMYTVRLTAGTFRAERKIMLVK